MNLKGSLEANLLLVGDGQRLFIPYVDDGKNRHAGSKPTTLKEIGQIFPATHEPNPIRKLQRTPCASYHQIALEHPSKLGPSKDLANSCRLLKTAKS